MTRKAWRRDHRGTKYGFRIPCSKFLRLGIVHVLKFFLQNIYTYIQRGPVGKKSKSKHEIHFCFTHTLHTLPGGNYILYFYCICVLSMTHPMRSGVEYSTRGVMLVLKKLWIQNISHFRGFTLWWGIHSAVPTDLELRDILLWSLWNAGTRSMSCHFRLWVILLDHAFCVLVSFLLL